MIRLLLLLRAFARGCWDIGCSVALGVGIALAGVGVLAAADSMWPMQLPEIRPLCPGDIKAGAIPLPHGQPEQWDSVSLYRIMSTPLSILDRVCPEVAEWTRGRWETGHMVFVTRQADYLACWDHLLKTLYIHTSALKQSDAELASILAHEFYHSRQSWFSRVQAEIARWTNGVDVTDERSSVEAPAYAWQERIRRAIYGWR